MTSDLRALARERGVQLAYTDGLGKRRVASNDALEAVLHALGPPDPRRVVVRRAGRALPVGYHREHDALVVAAPPRAPDPGGRRWGVFLPLYALRTAEGWGAGSLTDLARLADWAESLGASFVSTLPLYAQFPDGDASPYRPVSRLFWNELYADPTAAPELERCPEAREVLASRVFRDDLEAARSSGLVDYELVATLRRRVLDPLARAACPVSPDPEIDDYARFRASLVPADATSYHAYVQRLLRRQLADVGRDRLYLDLPLGVHPDGYDAQRYPDAFVPGVHAGAPPDKLFDGGQDWGFAPLHPSGGYDYLVKTLGEAFARARYLRLDHVMSLHRMYWIPDGMQPSEGVYVTYPARELYAILLVEAHLAGATVVGEDLGTVPATVRRAMAARGVFRMHVAQFDPPPAPVPELSFASLNTHDMEPFAAYGRGELHGWLRALASSEARAVVVNLEDLWFERERQNLPGTPGRTSWRRPASRTFEEFSAEEAVVSTLREVGRWR